MAAQEIRIDLWDVGQGDCSVITLPDGQLIIIDVGPASSPLVDWLSDGTRKIHTIAITHNDADHAGALPSIVKMAGLPIGQIYLLRDRNPKSKEFQKIFRPVFEEHQNPRRRLPVWTLTANSTLWQDPLLGVSLKVVFPNFIAAVTATTPNATSAVICWYNGGDIRVVWPGDAPMKVLADKCAGTQPFLLHGPHHGAPADRNKTDFANWGLRSTPNGCSFQSELPIGTLIRLPTI